MLAFLTTASIMAMNEANANGVAPGYRSVLSNPNLQAVSPPSKVWAAGLEHAWCAPRIPGMFEMEQALGNEINRALVGQISAKEALDNGNAAWKKIMEKNGFFSATRPSPMPISSPLSGSAKASRCRSDGGNRRPAARRSGFRRSGVAGRSRGGARPCARRCPTCWWRRRWSIS